MGNGSPNMIDENFYKSIFADYKYYTFSAIRYGKYPILWKQ